MAETKRSTTGADQPITRHPLFPAIVALWCGAIAGLCSLALSSSTIEGLVLMLGIDKVLPMAAPPLGATMRTLFALTATIAGAALGALVTRRLVRPSPSLEQSPLLASGGGELATEAAAEAAPATRRRRARIVEAASTEAADEDAGMPADAIVGEGAPFPAAQTPILNVADFEIPTFDAEFDAPPLQRSRPVEQAAQAEGEGTPVRLDTHPRPSSEQTDPADRLPVTPPPGAQIFQSERGEGAAIEALFTQDMTQGAGAREPGFSLFRRPSSSEGENETDYTVPSRAKIDPTDDAAEPLPLPRDETSAERIASADLATLSQLELVERLAIAMERRRDSIRKAAQEASSTALVAAATTAFSSGSSGLKPTDTKGAADPLPPLTAPDSDRSADFQSVEERSSHRYDTPTEHRPHGPADTLAVVPFPSARIAPEGDTVIAEDEANLQQGYSSLLNLSRQAAVRKPVLQFGEPDEAGDELAHSTPATWDYDGAEAEEAPAGSQLRLTSENEEVPSSAGRPFDPPTAGKTEATEKALRDALATLQRMSGVG